MEHLPFHQHPWQGMSRVAAKLGGYTQPTSQNQFGYLTSIKDPLVDRVCTLSRKCCTRCRRRHGNCEASIIW